MGKITTKKVHAGTIQFIARKYTRVKNSTFDSLASELNTTSQMISNLLFRGIEEDILSDRIADMIFTKVVYSHKYGQYRRKERWVAAFDKRDEKRSEAMRQKKEKEAKIAELEYNITNYANYRTTRNDALSKQELIEQLNALKSSCS